MPGNDIDHAIHRLIVGFTQGCGAPRNDNPEVRLLPDRPANEPASLSVRLVGDRASVDHQHIGIRPRHRQSWSHGASDSWRIRSVSY